MALPASDPFTVASGAGLGSNWTTVTGLQGPLGSAGGNAARPATAGGNDSAAWWDTDTFNDNQYSQIVIAALVTATSRLCGALMRTASGARTFYAASALGPAGATATVEIRKCVAASTTILATQTDTVNVTDTVKGTVFSTNITLYVNNSQRLIIADASIASGSAGIFVFTDTGTTEDARIDSWEAGNFSLATETGGKVLSFDQNNNFWMF